MSQYMHVMRESFELPSGSKVIKAQDYASWIEARDLLAAARQRAEDIITASEQAYASERERGYKHGFELGQEEVAQRIFEATQMTIDYLSTVEQQMVDAVSTSVRKILGEYDNAELTLRVVRHALSTMRNETTVTIRVSPDGASQLEQTLSGEFPDIDFINVVTDHTLAAGDCVLESAAGVMDASVEVQIAAIQRFVQSRFGTAKPAPPANP